MSELNSSIKFNKPTTLEAAFHSVKSNYHHSMKLKPNHSMKLKHNYL
ncbi:MAG: hypothetical protein HQK72_11540 [Desulfamplus sp.]|nr:hypothetical protein [Desulfamplus sp.]